MRRELVAPALAGALALSSVLTAQAPATAVFSNTPGAPTNSAPGLNLPFDAGGGNTAAFFRLQGSLTGVNWTVFAELDQTGTVTTANDGILIRNGSSILVRDGDPAPALPTETVGVMATTSRYAINDLGEVLAPVDLVATPDETVIHFDAAGAPTLVAREGDPIPGAAAGFVFGDPMSSPNIADTGAISFESSEGTNGEVIVVGSGTAVTGISLDDDVDSPGIPGRFWENFDLNDVITSPDGSTQIIHGDLDGTTDDDLVAVNNVVVLQQGQIVAGVANPVSFPWFVNVDAANNWYASFEQSNDEDVLLRNGVVIAADANPILPGSSELFDEAFDDETFQFFCGNLTGQFAFSGVTDNPDGGRNTVILLDDGLGNRRIIGREGDPVDIDGNGIFDDDRFLGLPQNESAILTLDNLMFVTSITNGAGTAVDNAIVRIPILGPLARFTPDGTFSSTTPFTVNFADESSSPSGALTYEWDFDGDGIVDSTAQNPSFTYNAPGFYTVSLTVTEGVATSTATVTNLIEVENFSPAITATPSVGAVPLSVAFADASTGPFPPTSWEWDFESDGVVDSTAQNPTHVYTTPGTFSVTATFANANGSATVVENDFIVVENFTAAISATPTLGAVPLNVNFSDVSTGPVPPTSWQWDFESDGVVDSTLQNPMHTYTVGGSFTVTAMFSNSNGSETVVATNLIQVLAPTANTLSPEILYYQFNEVTGDIATNTAATTAAPSSVPVNGGAGWQGTAMPTFGPLFEPTAGMLAHNPTTDASVDTGWAVNLTGGYTIMWWQRLQDPAGGNAYAFGSGGVGPLRCWETGDDWSFRGSSAVGNFDTVTPINAAAQIGIWNHLAIVVDDVANTATWYINGNVDVSTPLTGAINEQETTFVINALGPASTSSWANQGDMDDFRVYSRVLPPAEIMTAMAAEAPTSTSFGTGCGAAGTPTIRGDSAPQTGNLGFNVLVDNFAANALVTLQIGITVTSDVLDPVQPSPLPIDLGGLLPAVFPGCQLQVGLSAGESLGALPAGTGALNVPIPAIPALAGLHFYFQGVGLSGAGGQLTPVLDVNIQN